MGPTSTNAAVSGRPPVARTNLGQSPSGAADDPLPDDPRPPVPPRETPCGPRAWSGGMGHPARLRTRPGHAGRRRLVATVAGVLVAVPTGPRVQRATPVRHV